MLEERFVDVEEHFVIPRWFGVAVVVDSRGQFVVGSHVGDRECAEHFGHRREIVGGDDGDLEEFQR